ncbi:MAG TPA: COX15/CtaA family protein [Arenicellales bacterium]|nr:COX15/CtaA family protein [Arenicellales bacterium]
MTKPGSKAVAMWLFVCCALIYAMIVLGGVTRLSQSGLSMVDWDPIMGIVPPVSEADWQSVFERYKQFPEYQKVNRGMSLGEFKKIFYVEYAHRVLGRLIGVAFLLPLLIFVALGSITRPMIPRFAGMFVLGGLQGLMGWFMVMSGLVDRPSVSQYRLTAHLLLAVFIYGFILWSALSLWRGTQDHPGDRTSAYRFGWLVTAVVIVMIASGGFVAGTRAGFIYNTFPMMGGEWVPDGIWALDPGWRNLFENTATVQFIHRALALVVTLVTLAWGAGSLRRARGDPARASAWLMLLALALQLSLGVATLLHKVPLVLGAAHQAGAVALFTMVLIHTHVLKHPRRGIAPERQPGPDGRPGAVQHAAGRL